MTVWIVLGCIFLALALLAQVRVGGIVEFSRDGVQVMARLGVFKLTVYPWKHKKKPPKEKKIEEAPVPSQKETPAPPQKEEPSTKPGGRWDSLKQFLPLISDAAGRFKQKIQVDKLYLDVLAAGADPAAVAMAFGGVNAAVGMIWPLLENNFNIKDRRIRTAVDFQAKTPTVWLYASFSLTIGQAVSLTARLAIRFFKILSGLKAQKQQKEAV